MQFIRTDTDFRSHAEFAAVSETGGGVDINGRRINVSGKVFNVSVNAAEDTVTVA